jgi:hypothetical protein
MTERELLRNKLNGFSTETILLSDSRGPKKLIMRTEISKAGIQTNFIVEVKNKLIFETISVELAIEVYAP